jgi:hypothetical protein
MITMGVDTLLPSSGGAGTGSIRGSRPLAREWERDGGEPEDGVGEGEKVDMRDEGAGGGVVADGDDGEEEGS